MRLRKVKGAIDTITSNSDICITNPEDYKGKWKELFDNNNPIYLEIGSGKGQFIYKMAKNHPDINFLGMEKMDSVICRAIDKVKEEKLPNLKLIRADSILLDTFFNPKEISRIYLNFSDPWPKKRHYKRRLTNEHFLNMYQKLLPKSGEIWFKSDNRDLVEYSIITMSKELEILDISLDLHKSDLVYETTEFEDRFVSLGQRIYFIKAKNR